MALIGTFDIEIRPLCWFDSAKAPEGWFDTDLVGRGIVYNLSHTEATTATEIETSTKVTADTLLENLVASATQGTQGIWVVSLTEATTSSESQSSDYATAATGTEAITAIANESAVSTLVSSILASCSALDSSQAVRIPTRYDQRY